tara:strand:+ start:3394 stop:4704 length:1311 start_codon:yes stop_codon:yes gene_type:complete
MSTSLKRSKGSQSSLRIGTFSFWMKVCSQGNNLVMYSNTVESDNNRGYIQLTTDGKWRMVDNDASGDHIVLRTNRKFRDFNAWYHFVVRVDTTQSTNTDRVRLYINGVQETSFDETTYPAQNENLKIFEGGQTNREYINRVYGGSAYADNFMLSHFHFTDGQSYGPDTFGSTDSTTGEWKINTSPTVTYGNQGFFMFKDDASLNDDSGNGNNWTADSGTVQKTEDNPSNIFATLNPLLGPRYSTQTFSNGNTTVAGGGGHEMHMSTLAIPNSGKFYYEAKLDAIGNYPIIGVVEAKNVITNNKDINTYGYGYFFNGNIVKLGGSPISPTYSSYTTGDFIGVAVDCDNKEIYFSKNGTWQNSSDPANRTNPAITGLLTDDLMLGVNNYGSTWSVNFGNGYFGTTAVSSAGTNASGNGIFEYDVPTGYTALSTKGLNL